MVYIYVEGIFVVEVGVFRSYWNYVLFILILVYVFNFIDR